MARPLDADEEELARLLERAGLPRAAARCFAALLRGGAHTASALADAAGIARQDVTPAARALESRGLLRVERVATGGRPQNRYHLAREPRAAIHALAQARREELAQETAALDALEARFSA